MNIFILLIFFLSTTTVFAQRQKIDPVSFGVVKLAEDRMPIDVRNFKISKQGDINVKARLIQNSLQWVRYEEVLLLPRILIELVFTSDAGPRFVWQYSNQIIIPRYDSKSNTYRTKIFISLFEALPLVLTQKNIVLSKLWVTPSMTSRAQLIDYSCAPFFLKINWPGDDYLSVGCKMQRTGKFGREGPYLEILFTSASYRLKGETNPPYMIAFDKTGTAKIVLENFEGKEEVITISAQLPEKIPRLKLAGGLGPYILRTTSSGGDRLNQMAPTAMLYGNLTLNEANSLRFFDSYSKDTSIFHNWGLYYAWDLARFCDERCQLTSLVGIQGMNYKFNSNERGISEAIYPQGFEFVYKHPFGNLNYKLSYGMFTSLSGLYNYNNVWLRYGKNYFWELNFIEWKKERREVSMWGLSIGFPLGSFF